jgi:hypothetical protein
MLYLALIQILNKTRDLKTQNILIGMFLFTILISNAQEKKLKELRDNYCGKNCEIYNDNKIFLSKLVGLPPPAPSEISEIRDTLVPFFKIPLNKRFELFPFSAYDSVYVVSPKYFEGIKEPRNYLNSKFHDTKTLITKEQINKISDILFNYYEIKYNNIIERKYKITGCGGIEDTYPRIIFLFVKNGKNKDYIAFPSQIFGRTSFTNKELEGLDICAEKEKMIMEIFGVNIEN